MSYFIYHLHFVKHLLLDTKDVVMDNKETVLVLIELTGSLER